jgi:ketosteroid isomerase-like protein
MSEREAGIEANKRIARDFMNAMSSGEAERILALYSDDVSIWTAGSLPFSGFHDRTEVAALCQGLLGAFPEGLQFSIRAMTAEGERVAIEAEGLGTHASGKVYSQHYHFLLIIRDGKIAQMKEYFDTELERDVLMGGAA